jgi:hypothetical protein
MTSTNSPENLHPPCCPKPPILTISQLPLRLGGRAPGADALRMTLDTFRPAASGIQALSSWSRFSR